MRLRLRTSFALLLAALWVTPALAQGSGSILGRVTDGMTQRPVSGATVTFAGKTAVARPDGSYLLSGLPAGTDTLHVRMIGFAPHSEVVTVNGGQTVIADIGLSAQAVNLAEMVVVGYGEQAAGNITGAVTNVKPEEFNTGRIISPQELIQSKVAGVQVVESNEPGGGTAIRIRGSTSIGANNEPLIVVDGVPLGGGAGTGSGVTAGRDALNFVNPNDIASITVLRDASAAAIYGTNAANGVVIITTKKGTSNSPLLEYTGTISTSRITRTPNMLNASQFRAAVAKFDADNGTNQSAFLLNSNTDWYDQIGRNGFGQDHTIALSGIGGSNDYRFSLNYLNQKGIIDATKAERVTLGANYNQRLLKDQFNLKLNFRGSRQADDFTPGGVLSNAAQMGPTQPVRDPTALSGFYNWPGNPKPELTSADNPVEILALAKDEATTYRGVGGVQSQYNLPFLSGLDANFNVGFDGTKAERNFFNPSLEHAQIKTGTDGRYLRNSLTEINTVADAFLHYAVPRGVGPGLLDLTGGYSYAHSHGEFPTINATGLGTDALGTDGIPSARFTTATQNIQNSKLISFFGRVNYNINDRYLAALSVRHDGSSRFGPGHQWGTFPSIALAWRLSDEPFFKGFPALSDLKLRAAWAKTGNQSFGNYLWSTSFQSGDGQVQYFFGDTAFNSIRPNGVDPNIKWEATRSYNLGLDFGFKNQRFSGSIDWYDKRTTDLLFAIDAPQPALGDLILTNVGTMRNQGIEISLNAQVLLPKPGNLSWTTDWTFASNRNRLLAVNPNVNGGQDILTGSIAGGVGSRIQVYRAGYPVNSFFVFKQKYDASGKPLENEYEDLNGDGIVNESDKRPFHDPAPKFVFGHSSYLAYGKFDLGFTMRAYLGNYVYNNVSSNMGTYHELGGTVLKPYNLHRSVLETGFLTPQYFSDFYVEKASFLRMDNITLGYTFNLGGKPARVFGTIQNAFTITGYSGVDPTAGTNGIDNNIYPRSRTFSTGVSLRF